MRFGWTPPCIYREGYSKQDILNEREKVTGYINKYELIAWLYLGRSKKLTYPLTSVKSL